MIPNIFHFVHLTVDGRHRDFMLHHYLCIKSCATVNQPESIFFYCNIEPTGEWWERAKPYVTVVLVDPPTEIFGIPIRHPAHMSDVIRLQALIETGGFYADMDTIFVKPYTPLLNHDCVLGMQGNEGICPAVIGSSQNGKFVTDWLYGFEKYFKGGEPGTDGWCVHSVYYPHAYAVHLIQSAIKNRSLPLVTLLPASAFFDPLYHADDLKRLFSSIEAFPDAYSHHLWETQSKEYLESLTIEQINTVDTTYNLIARTFLD